MKTGIPARMTALLLALCLLLPCAARAEGGGMIRTVVEATCTEAGYVLITDPATDATRVEHLPAAGHAFGPWTADEAAGRETRQCSVCGHSETVRISTVSEEAMPKLHLTGSLEGIGKKSKVTLEAAFESPELRFEGYAVMTLQGHSTFGLPKRNYTIRFFRDAEGESKKKVQFAGWREEHKYILKANYYDLTQSRNLAGARLWSEMTACREGLSPRLAALPTLGAVDGFPVDVYLNGSYLGLYTMNLHKDDDLYGLLEGEESALVICNRQTSDESLFRAPAAFLEDYSSDWEIEYCGTLDEAWVRESFNGLIAFVGDSDDETFRQELPRRLDVNAAIDYLLLIYALGLPESGAKDMVMLHLDGLWIPAAFDMDGAFGLDVSGGGYLPAESFLPRRADGVWDSGTGSLLWDRLLNNYEEEIRARYRQLRTTLLTEEHLLSLVTGLTGLIPERSYDLDNNLYPGRPLADTDMPAQIAAFVPLRLCCLDEALEVEIP